MNRYLVRSPALGALLALLFLALPASALPLVTWAPSSIALTPGTTTIQFDINPNGTPLSGVTLYFSGLSADLHIVSAQTTDPDFSASSGQIPPNDVASFVGGFASDRTLPFTVGTLTVEGLAPGTQLDLLGTSSFTDGGFNDIPISQQVVATVGVPEPASAVLLGLGLVALVGRRRARA